MDGCGLVCSRAGREKRIFDSETIRHGRHDHGAAAGCDSDCDTDTTMGNEGLIEICMVRPDLDRLPGEALPPPFTIRRWGPGDLAVWLDIQHDADLLQSVTEETFRFYYGHDEAEFGRRILFLCDAEGRAIGTASAWRADPPYALHYGRVHWVAIVPAFQRRGLARPLLAAVLGRMCELGHTKAYLTTESARSVAIGLYRSLGFAPDVRSEAERRAWQRIR